MRVIGLDKKDAANAMYIDCPSQWQSSCIDSTFPDHYEPDRMEVMLPETLHRTQVDGNSTSTAYT